MNAGDGMTSVEGLVAFPIGKSRVLDKPLFCSVMKCVGGMCGSYFMVFITSSHSPSVTKHEQEPKHKKYENVGTNQCLSRKSA